MDYIADKLIDIVKKLRELSPLYEMVKEGIDLTKIEWQAHSKQVITDQWSVVSPD